MRKLLRELINLTMTAVVCFYSITAIYNTIYSMDNALLYGVTALVMVAYVIYHVVSKKRLDSEYNVLRIMHDTLKSSHATITRARIEAHTQVSSLQEEVKHWKKWYEEIDKVLPTDMVNIPTQWHGINSDVETVTTTNIEDGSYITIPFNSDNDTTTDKWICTECGEEMTRTTDKFVYCDNPQCSRKRFSKDKLGGEVNE